MRKEDKISLEINDYLSKKFHELSEEVGPYSNIIGVFYHELMVYSTNYLIIRGSDSELNQNISFPYLNSNYVRAPFLLKQKLDRPSALSFKTKILLLLIRCNNLFIKALGIKKEVTILFPDFFHIRQVVSSPFKHKINILKNSRCYLEKYSLQMIFMRNVLSEIAQLLEISGLEIFTENFLNYCDQYTTEENQIIASDNLIVQSPSILLNRINCANFLNSGKRVIAFSHGVNSFTSFDEPVVGYGELSYCTDYVDYGSAKPLDHLEYAHSLQTRPKIFYRSAEDITSIYKSSIVEHCQIIKNTKIAYLPNSLNQNVRYGPFRDICDLTYTRWQNALSKLNLNITCKAHPSDIKNKVSYEFDQVSTENLPNFVQKYDVFILDYFGTAYAYACATDKPVIYFNLGQRNMSSEFLERFKKRVYWVDIDLSKNFKAQILQAIEQYNSEKKKLINDLTTFDSIGANDTFSGVQSMIN